LTDFEKSGNRLKEAPLKRDKTRPIARPGKVAVSGFFVLAVFTLKMFSYPPAVGILGKAKSCLACHVNNGQWQDDQKTIIDLLDKDTMKSLRQSDGRFMIEVKRGRRITVLTVIGRAKDSGSTSPYRTAWIYLDPKRIGTDSLSIFAPGWDVNLQMACRLIGDKLPGFEGAEISVLPMTLQPLENARDSDLQLQIMLTKGEAVKGDAKKGMLGNYFERMVALKVVD
jgi:hypothetical protein